MSKSASLLFHLRRRRRKRDQFETGLHGQLIQDYLAFANDYVPEELIKFLNSEY